MPYGTVHMYTTHSVHMMSHLVIITNIQLSSAIIIFLAGDTQGLQDDLST